MPTVNTPEPPLTQNLVRADVPETAVSVPAGFAAPDQEEVTDFLRRHPDAAAILREALPHVRAAFGPATLSLRVIRDPDSGGAMDLFAFIQVQEAGGSALEKLDRFDEDWWMRRSDSPEAPVHFDLEYV